MLARRDKEKITAMTGKEITSSLFRLYKEKKITLEKMQEAFGYWIEHHDDDESELCKEARKIFG